MAGRCWLASLFVMHWSEAARGDGGGGEAGGFAELTVAGWAERRGRGGGFAPKRGLTRCRECENSSHPHRFLTESRLTSRLLHLGKGRRAMLLDLTQVLEIRPVDVTELFQRP